MNNKIMSLALIGAMLLGSASCSRTFEVGDELSPSPKVDYTVSKAYLVSENNPPRLGALNMGTLAFAQAPSNEVFLEGEAKLTFRVQLTRPVDKDITVELAVANEPALLEVYNKAHGETIKSFIPDGMIALSKTRVQIKAGKMAAEELVEVTVADASKLTTVTEGAFVAPIKITNVSGADKVAVSQDAPLFFLKSTKTLTNVKKPTSSPLTGKTKIDMSGFNFSVSRASGWSERYDSPYYVLDGDPRTSWYVIRNNIEDRTAYYQIQFPEQRSLVGFRLGVSQQAATSTPRTIEVLVQNATGEWTSQGVVTFGTAVTGYHTVEFYTPVKTTGIRFRILEIWNARTTRAAIGELELYE